mmetsp:Transcript_32091/g.76235  ORF Transcript_32091/g.76235 Transcript_32091/m.76235 type:complete len:333 (-) Transcript_32091:126-1124(-)
MVNMSSGAGGTRVFGSVRFVREDTGEAYNAGANTGVYVIPSDEDDVHGPVRMMGMMGQRAEPRASPHRWGGAPDGRNEISPMGVKRSRASPSHVRDSLRSRYSPGRPGSRRHQRWTNDQMLRNELDEDELKELYTVDWRSSLSELFSGDSAADNMKRWEEFCAADEEEQHSMLHKWFGKAPPKHTRRTASEDPKTLYGRLDRRVKGLLARGVARDFLRHFEMQLAAQLDVSSADTGAERRGVAGDVVMVEAAGVVELTATPGGATCALDDPLQRLVAHAVCLYHSLQSFTKDQGVAGTSSKMVIISWPTPLTVAPPGMLLHEYLSSVETSSA